MLIKILIHFTDLNKFETARKNAKSNDEEVVAVADENEADKSDNVADDESKEVVEMES